MVSKSRRSIKDPKDYRRPKETRAPYDYVLIVCEGKKTEPGYFEELCKHLRLQSANVKIAKNDVGSNPLSVVSCALDEYKKKIRSTTEYFVFLTGTSMLIINRLSIKSREQG